MDSNKKSTASRTAIHEAVNEGYSDKQTSLLLYNNIPKEMKRFPNWLVRKGKIPYSPRTDQQGNKPENCGIYNLAYARVLGGKYEGLGFQFSKTPYTGIDIDHCIDDNGAFSELALQAFIDFNSYTEYSPSGKGIHIIVKGNVPRAVKNQYHGIEIYSEDRYFTVTGNKVPQSVDTIEPRQDTLDLYFNTFATDNGAIATIGELISLEPCSNWENVRGVIENARNYDKSGKFKALFDDGDISQYNGDHSSADMALLCILAYWTHGNAQLMHDVFCQSALAKRKKWQEGNSGKPLYYRELSIRKAIAFYKQEQIHKIRKAVFDVG